MGAFEQCPGDRRCRPGIVRQFVAAQVVHTGKLKSLDDLEPNIITDLNARMSKQSNSDLEARFLEFVNRAMT
jgi:hypothetical protein